MKRTGLTIVFIAAALASMSYAQTATVDHLTQSELLAKARLLESVADAHEGSASTKLSEYPNHFTMIGVREQSGGAEVHQKYADFFLVLQGQASLTTGGAVVDAKVTSPGEIRGTSVKDGTQISLYAGDIVHIPANVPHQLLLAKGDKFIYFVIKVLEN